MTNEPELDINTAFFEVNGGRLAVQQCGAGDPLVLIHGMATDHRLWQPQLTAFAEHFRVITYDLRGFGESSRPDGPYRAEDDLARLLQILSLPAANIIGLSLGSSIATRFALEYPSLCRSLVLAGPVLQGFGDADDFVSALKQVWASGREQGVAAAKKEWLSLPLFTTLLQSDQARLAREMIARYDGWHWQNRDPESWPQVMPAERLGDINANTLVVVGDQEIPGLARAAEALHSGIADARLVRMDHAGHVVNLEQPHQFNKLVLEFLSDGR